MGRKKREIHKIDEHTIAQNIGDIEQKWVQWNFATKLNNLLFDKEISQKAFSEKTGIANSSLSDYRSGKMEPRITAVATIASFLGVSADYLLGISDIKSVELDVQNACKYTHLSENALVLLHDYPTDKEKELELKILSYLIEVGKIQEIISLLGNSLINTYKFDLIYSKEKETRNQILETDKLDFCKNVVQLYEDVHLELTTYFIEEIQDITATRIKDIQEAAEITKQKLEIILNNLQSDKLEIQAKYIRRLIEQHSVKE